MKYVKGDLIEKAKLGEFDVIVQGQNCFNSWSAGIAATIRKEFPPAYEADQKTIKGDKKKVGTYTQATVEVNSKSLTIINAYTQYKFWGDKGVDLFEYKGFENILKQMKEEFKGKSIAFPLIGCGLAGGDKERIMNMIKTQLEGMDITIVEWTKKHVPLYKNIK